MSIASFFVLGSVLCLRGLATGDAYVPFLVASVERKSDDLPSVVDSAVLAAFVGVWSFPAQVPDDASAAVGLDESKENMGELGTSPVAVVVAPPA